MNSCNEADAADDKHVIIFFCATILFTGLPNAPDMSPLFLKPLTSAINICICGVTVVAFVISVFTVLIIFLKNPSLMAFLFDGFVCAGFLPKLLLIKFA